jgi:hypothetical protein
MYLVVIKTYDLVSMQKWNYEHHVNAKQDVHVFESSDAVQVTDEDNNIYWYWNVESVYIEKVEE